MPSLPFEEEWTLVIKPSKRGINPAHLAKYQERMRRIAPLCAKETAHLKGERRVIAFNLCIARKTREEENGQRRDNNTH